MDIDTRLGFGCSRLPLTDPQNPASIDIGRLKRMVDIFLSRGFGYFDVASTYHDGHCEAAIRKALVDRCPRGRFILADKLPTLAVDSEEHQEAILLKQLATCGVEYFDRYIVHCATRRFYEKAQSMRSFEFVRRMKKQGLVRKVGFSFHDSPDLLDDILTEYPWVDFVQLQISYVDWELTSVRSRLCYETARRHRKPVVAMCPQKGGLLARVPDSVGRMFRTVRPGDTPSVWALRFAASHRGVETVLSGMSTPEQTEADTAFMRAFQRMDEKEFAVAGRAAEAIVRAEPVQCTSCGYCLQACPAGIPIPVYLRLYDAESEAAHEGCSVRRAGYESSAGGRPRASDCTGCRSCEAVCPQHIRVAEWMRRTADLFEPGVKAALGV